MAVASPARLRPMEGDASISDSDDESPSLPSRLSRTRLDLLGQEAGPAEATESYQFQTLPLEAQHALRAVISDGADELDLFRSDVCDDHLELISSLLRREGRQRGQRRPALHTRSPTWATTRSRRAARGSRRRSRRRRARLAASSSGATGLATRAARRCGGARRRRGARAARAGAERQRHLVRRRRRARRRAARQAAAALPRAQPDLRRRRAALAAAVGRGAIELQELWLASNRVGDAGLGALARFFAPGRGARQLDLQANRIGDAGLAVSPSLCAAAARRPRVRGPAAIGLAENRECTAAGKEALASVATAAAWRVALRL